MSRIIAMIVHLIGDQMSPSALRVLDKDKAGRCLTSVVDDDIEGRAPCPSAVKAASRLTRIALF